MPCVDWMTYLPKFKEEKGDDDALLIIKFHMHACNLRDQFREYCMLNIFMETLEGNA